MNCRNCGATMELFERRRYYFCRHCGTFHFLETTATDGVEVLARSTDAKPCPLCSAPLARALLDDSCVVEHCETCRGVLVARAGFGEAVARRRAAAAGPPAPAVPIDHRELQRRITCPSCRRPMDVHPYYGPGNVIIDTCSRCDLVWMDHGELKQITDAPGRDRGAPPAPRDSSDPAPAGRSRAVLRLSSLPGLIDLFD
jgi:Zn-finger nucleic acid-binding protein